MANTKDTAATGGKTYSYETAKNVLSDTEKNRLLCLFLNADHSSINWAKATTDFECASVESMRVMTRSTLKKITDAEKNGGTLPASTPKGKGAGGKKRKAAASGDDEDGTPTPTPAKKGKAKGKTKKADTPVEEDDGDMVKGEEEEEF